MKAIKLIGTTTVIILTILSIVACNNKDSVSEIAYVIETNELRLQPEAQVITTNTIVTQPKTHIVEIKDMRFQPETLTVHKGDTVIWLNKDIVTHDVTETNNTWASPKLAKGESWKKAITKSDAYYCSIHIIMKAKLVVE